MSKAKAVRVVDFFDYLAQNSDPYAECDVISISHSKNADSYVLHEYIHIIIRHKPTGAWRRLIAERQSHQDQVVIGFWDWVPTKGNAVPEAEKQPAMPYNGDILQLSSSGGSHEPVEPLPVLLRNLHFASLKLLHVAKVLVEVHNRAKKYSILWKKHCFWYADAVYCTLRTDPQDRPEIRWEEWLSYRWRAVILKGSSRDKFRQAAREFKKKIIKVPISWPPDDSAHVETGNREDEEPPVKGIEEVIEAFKQVDAVSNLDQEAILNANREIREDIVVFTDTMLEQSDKDTNLEYFYKVLKENGNEEGSPDNIETADPFIAQLVSTAAELALDSGTTQEEDARYEEAMRAFVGGVLRAVLEGDDGR